mgnify:CR=1 FL=1
MKLVSKLELRMIIYVMNNNKNVYSVKKYVNETLQWKMIIHDHQAIPIIRTLAGEAASLLRERRALRTTAQLGSADHDIC